MQQIRHQLFQQMSIALSHEQTGNVELALAYWENVLRLLPDDILIHNEILGVCGRIVQQEKDQPNAGNLRIQKKFESMRTTYQKDASDQEDELTPLIYTALRQQCGGNYALASAYWKNVRSRSTADSLIITLAVQDWCWNADQALRTKKIGTSITLYKQLLATFPEFLEGYINLSIILYKTGSVDDILALFDTIPSAHQQTFIISRYRELYQRMNEISQQFINVPYAAIEDILNDLRIENTFYPSVSEKYFTEFVEEIVRREQQFFEKRRRFLEKDAVSKTGKRLAQQGIGLGQRVTMAKQATSDAMYRFLHDNNIRIVEVLLDNPNIMADDVALIAQTTYVSEILTAISEHRKWGALHSIIMAVLFNPQTLPKDSFQLLKLLSISDLARVFYKKSIPTEVRLRARADAHRRFNDLSFSEKIAVVEATSGDIFQLIEHIDIDLSAFLTAIIRTFDASPDILVQVCRWKLTPTEVLNSVGRNPHLVSDTRIQFALLCNPKISPELMRFLVRSIPPADVEYFAIHKQIPLAVKQYIHAFFSIPVNQ